MQQGKLVVARLKAPHLIRRRGEQAYGAWTTAVWSVGISLYERRPTLWCALAGPACPHAPRMSMFSSRPVKGHMHIYMCISGELMALYIYIF